LTAQEAKSYILNLLGYPEQALTKDSAIVYRYTVYTAQEQMKHIIEADSEERLDIIRRLFGMDKYKRIASNCEIFAKELRSRARELFGVISDLSEKESERNEIEKSLKEVSEGLKDIKKRSAEQEKNVKIKKEEINYLQDKINELFEKKQKYSSIKTEFDILKERINTLKISHTALEPKISELKSRLEKFNDLKESAAKPDHIIKQIEELQKQAQGLLLKSASLGSEAESLASILDKGICGTCMQRVSDRESFSKGIKDRKKEIERISKEKGVIDDKIARLREELLKSQTHSSLLREKNSIAEQVKDNTELKERYQKELGEGQTKLRSLADIANRLAKEIKEDNNSEIFKKKQAEYEGLRESWEKTRRQESVLIEKTQGMIRRKESLGSEIEKKQKAKNQMESYVAYDRWVREFFVNLMSTIERHVLVNVQNEFNSLFLKWFSMLVMDEGLSARVDEDFSVIIEQNGFETQYLHLSGGERTAVALAYRLALNRVINDLTEKIKTKDLLILDEPTDGFSSEQMTSVRDVLEELNTVQTIIVSHEPRVEGFVDSTIRVTKDNHCSRILLD
jgi:DNA repair protein SbcC/Rad50